MTKALLTANASPFPDMPNAADIGAIAAGGGNFVTAYLQSMRAEFFSGTIWLQLGGIMAAVVLALLASRLIRAFTGAVMGDLTGHLRLGRQEELARNLIFPLIASMTIWTIIAAFARHGLPVDFMRIVGAVLVAFLFTRIFAKPGSDAFWRGTVIVLAIVGALMIILRLIEPFLGFVDSLTLPFGENMSLLDVLKLIAVAIALIWCASFLARIVEAKLRSSEHMTPSVRGLFAQLVRILMIGIAVFFALNMVGIDLTTFAVFTGALGVGIGFGLQSIFSNFVAGIIIILEKSLKVGDFVDLEGGITGEVKEINVRSTLITTNDNIDMLVPNSEFINNRVTNWTLRDAKRRIHVPFGVAYGTDKELVKKAVLEAADSVSFTLKDVDKRQPDIWLVGFGDSSLDFELIVWLTDEATKKPAKVHATYCWAIETALSKYGIVIPFPQRDLHLIRSAGDKIDTEPRVGI